MQKASELIKASQTEQTKQQGNTSPRSHSDRVFVFVWRGLQAGRFISKDDEVGGTDYKYWQHQLRNLTDEQLQAGLRATENFEGYMTWSSFRNLCLDASRVVASHRPYQAIPQKYLEATELRSRIKKMREEVGI